MRNKLKKMLPDKRIEVTLNQNGEISTEKMSLREIVGHIIDERRNEEFADIHNSDYVQTRLSMYGITDAETRNQIIEAVDAARAFNDELYLRANDELVKNGHYGQTYNYRQWYMHHYNTEDDNRLLAMFGIHTSDDEISQVFTDDTGNRRPSHQFNAAGLERHGSQTGYDFYESVDRSLDAVMNTIYQTGNIDRLKQLEQAINGTPKLDEKGNYVYENNKVVLETRPMFEVDADGKVANKNHLVGFGNAIGQFAQRAANKRTGEIDRAIMNKKSGRKAMSWLKLATSMRSAAAVAFNPMSATTNTMDEDATVYDKIKGHGGALLETMNPVDFFTSGESATVSSMKDIITSVDDMLSGEAGIWDCIATIGSAWFPGGATIKRAAAGIKSVNQGYSEMTGGKVKYTTGKPTTGKYIAAAVGGVNVLPESKAYTYGFSEALDKSQSATFKELLGAGLDPALAWSASRGTKAAQKATNDAENIATVAGVTEDKVAESEAEALRSRKETGMPGDIASWGASAFAEDGNNAVKTGVQAWIDYGVATYPKEINTETFGLEDTSYIRQDGVAHPLDEQDYAAINALYKEKYEQTVKLYGRINSPEAAKELEKALNKIRTEARNEYMQKGYFERERGEE